jgi:inosine/xanthosine triphosphatase
MSWNEVVALGSTSEHKVSASFAALRLLVGEARQEVTRELLRPVEVDSGVPPQPFGLEETRRGALNRATAALNAVPEAKWGLGVESGLVLVGEAFLDLAVVAVLRRGRGATYTTSVGIEVPVHAARESIASSQQRTIGEVLGCAGDPHHALSHGMLYREQLLEQAIFANLARHYGAAVHRGEAAP